MMVGDRGQDIAGARCNGLYAVGVTYGFGTLEELAAARPDHLVACSSEIPALLLNPAQRA
jgi:phosphoglycolate phosphatase